MEFAATGFVSSDSIHLCYWVTNYNCVIFEFVFGLPLQ